MAWKLRTCAIYAIYELVTTPHKMQIIFKQKKLRFLFSYRKKCTRSWSWVTARQDKASEFFLYFFLRCSTKKIYTCISCSNTVTSSFYDDGATAASAYNKSSVAHFLPSSSISDLFIAGWVEKKAFEFISHHFFPGWQRRRRSRRRNKPLTFSTPKSIQLLFCKRSSTTTTTAWVTFSDFFSFFGTPVVLMTGRKIRENH